MALEHGKHVVCEKPLGVSFAETKKMTDLASEKNLFLLEAMWMRFLPCYREAIRRVKSGEIGEVKHITASFGFRSEISMNLSGRLMNPDLAGGALYDVGVYPLTMVSDLFGWEPEDFSAHAIKSTTGVDETIQIQLDFGDNRLAQVMGSVALHTNKEACIYGETGFIKMPLFWKCQSFEVHKGEEVETVELPFQSTGYAHEIIEAARCIADGKTESSLFTWQDSLKSTHLVERILNTVFK
jgi:predicted dehydrogenase